MKPYDENSEPVEFDVQCQKELPKSLYCWFGDKAAWIPKSQILDGSEVRAKGDKGVLIIPAWLAAERGWRWIG